MYGYFLYYSVRVDPRRSKHGRVFDFLSVGVYYTQSGKSVAREQHFGVWQESNVYNTHLYQRNPMYRKAVNATEEQIQLLWERCTVRPEDGQMLQCSRPVGSGKNPRVRLRVGEGVYIQHSLAAVAWLLAYGNYPEHHVSFKDGTRDCRPSNLKRTSRSPYA